MQIGFTQPWWQPLSQASGGITVNIDPGLNGADVVVAIFTAVLTFFAGVQIWREMTAAKLRQRGADVRASAEAYKLQRRMLNWVGNPPSPEVAAKVHWATGLRSALGEMDVRMIALLELAAEASGGVRTAVKASYVRFYKATEEVSGSLTAWRERNFDSVHGHTLATQTELNACATALAKAIDKELLAQTVRAGFAGPLEAAEASERGSLEISVPSSSVEDLRERT